MPLTCWGHHEVGTWDQAREELSSETDCAHAGLPRRAPGAAGLGPVPAGEKAVWVLCAEFPEASHHGGSTHVCAPFHKN